jgi:hypothetical protein
VAAVPQPAGLGRLRGLDLRTVSLLFWYVGLIPDLATLRDRAKSPVGARCSTACSRWAGAARPALAPLRDGLPAARRPGDAAGRLGAHIVSFDFAVSSSPAGTPTIFPPYFVAGAIFAGFAMVLTLAIPLRKFYGSRTSSPCATSTTWPRSCSPPG